MARKYAIGQAIPDPISGGLDALRQGLIAMQEQKSRGVRDALEQRQLDLLKIKQEQEAKDFEAKNAPVDFEPLRPYYSPEEQAGYDKTYGAPGPDGKIAPYKIPRAVADADLERRKLLASMKEADAKLAGNKKDTVSLKRVYAIRGVPYPEGQEDVEVKLSDVDQFIPKPANEKEKESQLTEVPAEEYFQSIGRKMPPRFAGKTIKVKLPEYGQAPKAESIDRRVRLADLARVRGVEIPADLGETLVDPSTANELFGAVKEPKEDNSMTVNQARALRGLPPVRGEEGSLRIKASDIDNLFGRIEAPKKEDALITIDEGLQLRGEAPIGGAMGSRKVKPADLDNLFGKAVSTKESKRQFTVPAEVFFGGAENVPAGLDPATEIPIGNQTLKPKGASTSGLTEEERAQLIAEYGWAPTTPEGGKMLRAKIVADQRSRGLDLNELEARMRAAELGEKRIERKEERTRRDTENLSKRIEKSGTVSSIEPMRQLKAAIGNFSDPNAKLNLSKLPGRGTTAIKSLPFVGNILARETARSYGGENVLQNIQSVNNALLKVSSGTAVSAAEEARKLLEQGMAAGGTEKDIVTGLRLADKAFALEDQAIRGGYNSEAKNLFELQGGVPSYSAATSAGVKSESAPKSSAGDLAAQAKAELARRKAKKKGGK